MSVGEEAKSTCPMPRRFRPAGAGVDIIIRYITRAGVRVETRNHLFAMIVDLMQGESKDDTNRASLRRKWERKDRQPATRASRVGRDRGCGTHLLARHQ